MKTVMQFFTENNGRLSMMRLLSCICVVSGCVGFFVYPDHETGYLGMIALGLTGKATQKTFEVKKEKKVSAKVAPNVE